MFERESNYFPFKMAAGSVGVFLPVHAVESNVVLRGGGKTLHFLLIKLYLFYFLNPLLCPVGLNVS